MIKSVGFAVALLASCVAAAPAGAQDASLSELRESAKLQAPEEILADLVNGEPETAVIVHLRPTPAAMELAARSRAEGRVPEGFNGPGAATYYDLEDDSIGAELRATVAEQVARVVDEIGPYGMSVTQRFSYQFGFAARVTPAALARILAAPDVIAVEKDAILHGHLKQGIPLMNATATRSAYLGAGVSIAICDTGIDTRHPRLGGTGLDTSPMFNAKVIGGHDVGDGDEDPRPGNWGQAHGTACAGIAAGGLGPVGDYAGGVAPYAKLYAIKISEGIGGSAYTSKMIAGWEWCITHRNDSPANPLKVISTSFGGSRFTSTCDGYSAGMTTAAANAVAAGITLFVSSGNDGYCNSTAWPACISHVNSVGAVYDANVGTKNFCVSAGSCAPKTATAGCDSGFYATDATAANLVTSYSNSASFLTLFAPSNDAYTTDIVGSGGYEAGDYDSQFGGTSAASPYAAGAAAVLQSAARIKTGSFLTPAQVRSYLVTHGDSITDAKVASVTKPKVNLGKAANAIALVPGTLQFSASTFSVTEGVATVQVKVTRAGNSIGAVGVSYATSNVSAGAGDYTAAAGTLSWANRDFAAKSFTVPILDDAKDEANEAFRVTLTAPTGGAALGTRSVAGVVIQDNDPAPTVQFDAAASSTPESTPAAVIGVSLSAPSALTVKVNYATANGTATASDYTATSGTLTFAPGVTTRNISVPIFNDLREEADETFTVALSAPVHATLGAAATHTATIANDDPAPTVQFRLTESSGAESVSPASIEVVLSAATWKTVTVGYVTADGSAVAGEDYTAKSGTLTFSPGVMSRTIEVPIVASPAVEPSELFAVVLTSPTNASLGAPGSHLYTILDQSTHGVIRLSVPGYVVNEAGPTVTIAAVRAGGGTGAVGVSYATLNGTAKAGSDFTATTGTLSWAAGDTANKTFRVPITNDGVKDANETFTVRLSAPTGGAVLGMPDSATVVILDND